jgi:cell division septal protein FtsQ
LSDQYDWEAKTTDSLIIKLGGDQLISSATDRLENLSNSFFWLKEKLDKNLKKEVSLVDLRYAQGFAFKTSKIKKQILTHSKENNMQLQNCLLKVKWEEVKI